jgi:hypothetical protein
LQQDSSQQLVQFVLLQAEAAGVAVEATLAATLHVGQAGASAVAAGWQDA